MGPTWVLSAPDGPHVDPMLPGYTANAIAAGDLTIYGIDSTGAEAPVK